MLMFFLTLQIKRLANNRNYWYENDLLIFQIARVKLYY